MNPSLLPSSQDRSQCAAQVGHDSLTSTSQVLRLWTCTTMPYINKLSKKITETGGYGDTHLCDIDICDTSIWRLRQEDHKFKASLGKIMRPCLKEKKKQ
jgi:hypothetical protein